MKLFNPSLKHPAPSVRERVYKQDWYNVYPPSAEERHAAYVKCMKK